MSAQNMLLWYKHYFELKAIENQQVKGKLTGENKIPFVKKMYVYKGIFHS